MRTERGEEVVYWRARARGRSSAPLANRPAVISALRHEISGLVAIRPEGGKMARAQAVSPQVESCNIYVPHPAIAPWVPGFIDECSSFPNGK